LFELEYYCPQCKHFNAKKKDSPLISTLSLEAKESLKDNSNLKEGNSKEGGKEGNGKEGGKEGNGKESGKEKST
jgi:hypothetical protein